jgi:hypothetical protein
MEVARYVVPMLLAVAISQVTEGASTSSEAIELRVSDSIYASRLAVIIGVKAIEDYLATKETTPIA